MVAMDMVGMAVMVDMAVVITVDMAMVAMAMVVIMAMGIVAMDMVAMAVTTHQRKRTALTKQ